MDVLLALLEDGAVCDLASRLTHGVVILDMTRLTFNPTPGSITAG